MGTASISVSKQGEILGYVTNTEQKDHGGFLQPAIKSLLENLSISIRQLDAVAISAGPGSYTGLRVGMASAKGLCYALNKPLILVGTLEILAFSAILSTSKQALDGSTLICPMIDARRMEVFTALYDTNLANIQKPSALILDQFSFANNLLKNKIIFFGNGSKKWERICNHGNATFINTLDNPLAMSKLAFIQYDSKDFSDLVYSEPLYIKNFFEGS